MLASNHRQDRHSKSNNRTDLEEMWMAAKYYTPKQIIMASYANRGHVVAGIWCVGTNTRYVEHSIGTQVLVSRYGRLTDLVRSLVDRHVHHVAAGLTVKKGAVSEVPHIDHTDHEIVDFVSRGRV